MSSNSTQYNVVINDEVVETKSKKAQAIAAAEAKYNEDTSVRVVVQTSAGTEVQVFEPKGTHSKPWTRVAETKLELDIPAGYTVAYTRERVGALVARADDKSDWIVITSDNVEHVKNTTEARELTNALAAAHKESQVAARAAQDAAKAEAKVKREQEREAKKAEREADKARKAAEKQAAKDAKDAEAAAAAEATEAA